MISVNRRPMGAHRLAYKIANGEDPGDLCVCHRCDVRACVNPAHLFLGTIAENNADMDAKGRRRTKSMPGTASPNAKLTEQAVIAMRSQFRPGRRGDVPKASAQFGISKTQVARILRRKTWVHI
ncbi:HNH endonuclease [Rhizorhabdus wittichii]|uniref:HNH endonuclease n=1 Tax=Rhizorhabdus wittichii TaxID=160791 RepID=A0A975HC09_9SPHN|nr:HNH endonuclease signature motif containing protein [Rhizorhabdus wittichii]QTH19753.1 HNH endonuclease [Rhizorhabdus wittichii]